MQKLEEYALDFTCKTPPANPTAIDECYDAVLEAQMVPPQVRQTLSENTIGDKKWQTILAFHSMMVGLLFYKENGVTCNLRMIT